MPERIDPDAAVARLVVDDDGQVCVTGSLPGVDPEQFLPSDEVVAWIRDAGGCYSAGFLAVKAGFEMWVPVGAEPVFLRTRALSDA